MSILAQSPISTLPIAFRFGAEDAHAGAICCPEMLFSHLEDKRSYARGYASVEPTNDTARYFLSDADIDALFAAVVVDDSQLTLDLFDHDAATDELIDGMADDEFNRRGC